MSLRCPNSAQALAMIVMLSLGGGLLLFGFLHQFHLNVVIKGISAGGAGAVFILIYLIRPTVLVEISCISHAMPLRVINADKPTQPVAGAVVHLRGTTTESSGTAVQSTPPLSQSHVPAGSPFKNVMAIGATVEDIQRVFASRHCKLGTVVNELRECTYASLEACENNLAATPPGAYKANHKCIDREEILYCYAQQTKGFTGTGNAHCYPDLASCEASVAQLSQLSEEAEPPGSQVCHKYRVP